ncbi:MAG: RnfABCDGE type electron transport complex subunit G, partial [Treponemataceae bacterium]|nr:RnfABCDGE type electron transport complex subunit G [Treponemataceae bacterium]
MKGIARIGLALGVVCLVAAVSLAAVNYLTKGEIERRKTMELQENLKVVFPNATEFKERSIPEGASQKEGSSILSCYEAFVGGNHEGYVFRVSTMGYGGEMILLVGISRAGALTGIQVLEHQETPGLGSNITGEAFRNQFVGKSIDDPVEAKKDVQAVTGATIST